MAEHRHRRLGSSLVRNAAAALEIGGRGIEFVGQTPQMVGNIGGRRGQFTQLLCAFAQEFYCVSHNTGVNR